MRHGKLAAIALMSLAAASCREGPAPAPRSEPAPTPSSVAAPSHATRDEHSYGNPEEIRVTHADLDWDVGFDRRVLRGTAALSLKRPPGGRGTRLVLDSRALDVAKVEASRTHVLYLYKMPPLTEDR